MAQPPCKGCYECPLFEYQTFLCVTVSEGPCIAAGILKKNDFVCHHFLSLHVAVSMSCCAVAILLYQGFSCQPYNDVSFESVEHIDVSQVSYHDSIGFLYKSNVYTDEWKAETQWRPVSLSYSFILLEYCILHDLRSFIQGVPTSR